MTKPIILQKQAMVESIQNSITNSQSMTVVEYRGLTVSELEELRRELRKEEVEFKVLKNTLVSRAVENLGHKGLEEVLTGPNAVVFSHKDAVSGPRVLAKFAKKHDKLVLKGGIVEGNIVDEKEIKVIATLPGKEGLLSMFLSCLQSPVRSFACAVKAVAEKAEGTTEA